MSTLLPTFINVNVNGIPALRSLGVTVTATDVRFDFNNHRNVGAPFRGLIIINLAQAIPTGTTGTLPVLFTSDGGNAQPLTTINGDAVTAADITGTAGFVAAIVGFALFAIATILTVWSGITYVLKNKQVLADKKD